jgi:hypothetical protein
MADSARVAGRAAAGTTARSAWRKQVLRMDAGGLWHRDRRRPWIDWKSMLARALTSRTRLGSI